MKSLLLMIFYLLNPVYNTSRILLLTATMDNPDNERWEEIPPESCYHKLKNFIQCINIFRKEQLWVKTEDLSTVSVANSMNILNHNLDHTMRTIFEDQWSISDEYPSP